MQQTKPKMSFELIELIEEQGELIRELSATVARLLLQNAEQENYIDELIDS